VEKHGTARQTTSDNIKLGRKKRFVCLIIKPRLQTHAFKIQGGSNMTGTDLYVNKPHCAAAVRP